MSNISLPFNIQSNVCLKPYNTFRFAYRAQYLVEARSASHLMQVLAWAVEEGVSTQVIGGGSNLLICSDLDGLVIVNRLEGMQIITEDDMSVVVRFSGGETWHHCVEWAVHRNYGGIENLALIPGTAGAAPVQNIGAYGVEVGDMLTSVRVLDCASFEVKNIAADQCGFGYRDSKFKGEWSDQYIILSIDLALSKLPHLTLSYGGLNKVLNSGSSVLEVFHHVCKTRQQKLPDPSVLGNAGSFFKNPLVTDDQHRNLKSTYPELVSFKVGDSWKLAAGWLNDQAGWKGVRVGGVGVYDKQALVLVNYSDESAEGLLHLEHCIKASINEHYGVVLEREPVLLGGACKCLKSV